MALKPTMALNHDDYFFKRKPSEEEYLALCLIMLAKSSATTKTATKDLKSLQTAPKNHISSQETRVSSFKCSFCDKVFSSHQALGGHKASHSKPSSNSISDKQPKTGAGCAAGRTHECSICHKSFPTGQALGGHKRRHYEGHIGSNTTSSSNSEKSQNQSQSQSRGGGGLGFDLNMLPENDDKGEEFESRVIRKKPRLLGDEESDV